MKKFFSLACAIFISLDLLAQEKLPVNEVQQFVTVVEHIKNYYVEPITDKKIYANAINGVLAGLDPHSSFLTQEDYADLKAANSGKFGGIGLETCLEDGFIKVITPIDNSPAEKAGILPGDLIVKIDDTLIKGMSFKASVNLMRGKPGSKIKLSIMRAGLQQPLNLELTRDIINLDSVSSKIIGKNYLYIRISQFQTDTADELLKNINLFKKRMANDLHAVILDLRNNPGGVLDASVAVANMFLDHDKLKHEAMIVYTKGRNGIDLKEVAKGQDELRGISMAVLINAGSASASEIVAGALQDHRRALIVGQKSFGKGSVQSILPLKDKQALKITTALYYTPAGNSIQATGIKPDILIEDLKIPLQAENQSLKEENLQGHLGKTPRNSAKDSDNLLYQDYQLYETINILKGFYKTGAKFC